jgi:hypothetical protein
VFAAKVKHSGNKSFGIGHERGAPGSLALLRGIQCRREGCAGLMSLPTTQWAY